MKQKSDGLNAGARGSLYTFVLQARLSWSLQTLLFCGGFASLLWGYSTEKTPVKTSDLEQPLLPLSLSLEDEQRRLS